MNKFLPIGSIVYLKNSLKKVMITGRIMEIEEKKGVKQIHEYCGCIFPDGVDSNQMLVFARKDITSVINKGYEDSDEIEMRKRLHIWLQENGYEEKIEKEGLNLEL